MTGMTNDLITWLRAQLDEDARVAYEACAPVSRDWAAIDQAVWDGKNWEIAKTADAATAVHMSRWDPERALAEIDAKRQLLDLAERQVEMSGDTAESILSALALPYADRCREEWKP